MLKTQLLEKKSANKNGYSAEVLNGINNILADCDFSLQPSELIYKQNSTEKLQKKLNYAKSRINNYLEKEKAEAAEHSNKTSKQPTDNFVSSKEDLLKLVNSPDRDKNPELKHIVFCHLKECSVQEFQDLINRREVKNLFSEQDLVELKKAREQEAALKDVVESGKQTKDKLLGKDDEEQLTEEEQQKIALYGVETNGLTANEIRGMLKEIEENAFELPGLQRDLRPH